MDNLVFAIEQLKERKEATQCEILTIFEYGRSPSDNEYIHDLHKKVDELRGLQFAINKLHDLRN